MNPRHAHFHRTSLRRCATREQAGRCYYCESLMCIGSARVFAERHGITEAEAEWFGVTLEHLVAQCDGGKDRSTNTVAACKRCNQDRPRFYASLDAETYRLLVRRQMQRGDWWSAKVLRRRVAL